MRSKMRLVYGLGVLLLAASCTQPGSGSSVFVSARPQLVAANDRGEVTAVPAGQPLRAGQVFALDLVLEQPAHVYVVHRRGGLVGSLYPGVGQADVKLPAGPQRVPGGDTFMRVPALDRQTHLCVLLSSEVLSAAQRRCPDAHERPHSHPRTQAFLLIN